MGVQTVKQECVILSGHSNPLRGVGLPACRDMSVKYQQLPDSIRNFFFFEINSKTIDVMGGYGFQMKMYLCKRICNFYIMKG